VGDMRNRTKPANGVPENTLQPGVDVEDARYRSARTLHHYWMNNSLPTADTAVYLQYEGRGRRLAWAEAAALGKGRVLKNTSMAEQVSTSSSNGENDTSCLLRSARRS